ncbi:MAG: hypothetical protein JNL70_04725 [Saprospiraceae bacterium]|nr:hypothetical protein [Saprospiraceae bacterium]
MANQIKKPSLFWFFTEGMRAIIEHIGCLIFMARYRFTHKGDGHPVLAVPGFLCTDYSMRYLRKFVNKLGYTAYGWELGRNMCDLKDLNDLNRLNARVDEIYRKHNTKITLIGWSMGGVYVRELAKQRPHLFRQVITMGSPFGDGYAPTNGTWLFELLHDSSKIDDNWRRQIPNPAPIRTTAIYTKQDGIVPWAACLEKIEDDLHQNIEVVGSHWALGMNPTVLKIVEDKLVAQQEAENAVSAVGNSPLAYS